MVKLATMGGTLAGLGVLASVFLHPIAYAQNIDITGTVDFEVSCPGSAHFGDVIIVVRFDFFEDVTTGDVTGSSDLVDIKRNGTPASFTSNFPKSITGTVTGNTLSIDPIPVDMVLDGSSLTFVTNNFVGTISDDDGDLMADSITGSLLLDSPVIDGEPSGALPCTFTTLAGYFTPIGTYVTINTQEVSLTFSSVDSEGETTIDKLDGTDGDIPPNFEVFGMSLFYDVVTTASVSGPITFCLDYDDEDNDGYVDGTTVDETTLRLLHNEGGTFVDRTSSLDIENNVICAEVDSLSEFALVRAPPVGGISVDPDLGALPLETAQSSGSNAGVLAGIVAAAVASALGGLGGAAWYLRRRRLR